MSTFFIRSVCPCCGGEDLELLFSCSYLDDPVKAYIMRYYKLQDVLSDRAYEDRFSGAVYEVMRCRTCELVFQRQVPNEAILKEVYAKWIPNGKPDRPSSQKDHRHYISEALRLSAFVLRSAKKNFPREISALDFGLGKGGFALAMMGTGMRVSGYDFADDRQAEAAQRGIAMITDAQIDELKFDFINTEQVFEHLSDPGASFGRLSQALNPGGVLKVSVPFSKSIENGDFKLDWNAGRYERNTVNAIAPLEHLQYYRKPSLNTLAAANGLEAVKVSVLDELNSFIDLAKPKRVVRQIGSLVMRSRIRNYHLFRKPD